MVPGDEEEEDNTSQKADKQEKEGYDPQDSDVEENEQVSKEPYDFNNLPSFACVYCGVHDTRCVVQCRSKNCNKWFCNGKG